ncbi:MAG: hypothetical protein WCW14_00110 [Candidatus Paceibacterota bacterium]|jgi:hypothetical protein
MNETNQIDKEFGKTERTEWSLGMHTRNCIQMALMQHMLGRNPDSETELKWITEYRSIVSKIIDDPNNLTIRKMIETIDSQSEKDNKKTNAESYVSIIPFILDHPLMQNKIGTEFENAA